MARKKPTKRDTGGPQVGSTVRFRFGISDVTATVTEDRGPLGVGGEHLFRVRFEFGGAGEYKETEIESSRLTVVGHAA